MNNFEHFGIPAEKTISYTLELLTPYEKSLGTIPMVLNYNYKNKLIGLNEIDFDIPAYMIVEDKEKAHPFFHLIENGMIIQVTIVGQTEPKQYIVDTANKSTDKSSEALKHIHAFSKEYFLSRKKFLGMELAGRILYYTPDLPAEYATDGEGLARGVLNDIFTKYGIKVSHIDETLKKKAREVSIGSGNIYQLISHLEEVFGCIFKFNGNATEVAIYDSSTFGRKTNLTISERNIINSFSEDSRYEDMVTRMYVYGSDDISIASVNPTGLPYIEDLTYFLKEQFLPEYLIELYKEFIQLPKNTGLLQAGIQERNALLEQIIEAEFYLEVVRDELRQATHWVEALQLREKNGSSTIGSDPQYSDETAWNRLKKSADVLAFIDAVKKNTTTTDRVFTANNISFVSLLELSRSADDELTNLFKDNLETLQARGGEAGWLAEITRLNNALKAKEIEIKNLQQNNDFDNYMKQKLTTEQLVESRKAIEAITIEGEYINSDLDSSMLNELLAEGEKALAKACFPKIQFQVEALDFSQLLDTEDLWNYLTLGDTVFIKSDTGFNYPVYFIGIEHSPESASLNLQFSSAAAMTDSAIFLADLIASATRANGILALNRENWNEAAEGTTLIKAQLQQGLDLAKQQLDGASKQQPILDERGFWLYALDTNGNPKPEQIRAVNNVIALTEDGWETINVAITPQGINADTIVVGTLSADRVRLGRFESADMSTFWDLETNEIKIGENFHFSPSTGLQINLEEEPKHKNLISTAGFFVEQSVLLPYGATHGFETNPSTGELSLIMPKQSGTYIFYIASDSATLTQDFTLLVDNLTTYGGAAPTIKYALVSTQFDLYSEEVTHVQGQKIYTLKLNDITIINPLGFLQVSVTKYSTESETIVKIPAESLALVKNNVANLTWEDTEISGVSSSAVITNEHIGLAIENNIENKLAALDITEDGITTRVESQTKTYIDNNIDKLKGTDGADGAPGKDGIGIVSTTIAYAVNQSGTTYPTTGWLGTVPKTNPGDYIWTKTTWKYTDDTSEDAYSVGRIGVDGPSGEDGLPGAPGVGIKMTTITYTKSTSGTVIPPSTATWSPSPPAGNPGEFIWTKTVWTYTDNTTETGYSVGKIGNTGPQGIQGANGKDGAPGKGIKDTRYRYAKTSAPSPEPTESQWSPTKPDYNKGDFAWTQVIWEYTDGTVENSAPMMSYIAEDGVGISETLVAYALSTTNVQPSDSLFSPEVPDSKPGDYVWTRVTLDYTDPSKTDTKFYTSARVGKDGATPYIGTNGNWWINGIDTGVQADVAPIREEFESLRTQTASQISEMVTKTVYNADTGKINESILNLTKTSEGLSLEVKELSNARRVKVDSEGVPIPPYYVGNLWYKDFYDFTQGYDIIQLDDKVTLGEFAEAGIWVCKVDKISSDFSWNDWERIISDSQFQTADLSVQIDKIAMTLNDELDRSRSEFIQLSNLISQKVTKDDLIGEINTMAGNVVLKASADGKSSKLNLTANGTEIENALIKDAHISTLNVSKITGDIATFVKTSWNAINSSIAIDGNKLVASHTDGTKTVLDATGLYTDVAGAKYKHSYLTYANHYFKLNAPVTAPVWVTLPPIWKGRKFEVMVSIATTAGMNALGNESVLRNFSVGHVEGTRDYVNGRFQLYGICEYFNTSTKAKGTTWVDVRYFVQQIF